MSTFNSRASFGSFYLAGLNLAMGIQIEISLGFQSFTHSNRRIYLKKAGFVSEQRYEPTWYIIFQDGLAFPLFFTTLKCV